MSKVIQIRDVPEDVHDALAAAAAERDMSLTKYLQVELRRIAGEAALVRHNAKVVRRAKAAVGTPVSRAAVLEAIREGRGE